MAEGWLQDAGMKKSDAKKWVEEYKRKVGKTRMWKSFLMNINPDGTVGNDYLRERIASGELSVSDVAGAGVESFFPDRWKDAYKKKADKLSQVIDRSVMFPIDEFYSCKKCGKGTCTREDVQRRSGDEGNSSIITCTKCGDRWIINN